MKVIICGGRHYSDVDRLFRVMDKLDEKLSIVTVVHGYARGADQFAAAWARTRGKWVEGVLVEWDLCGKAAGPMRNQRMLDMKPDAVIAFPGGRGTADMMRRARKAGVSVFEIE